MSKSTLTSHVCARAICMIFLLQASNASAESATGISGHVRVHEAIVLLQHWLKAKRDYEQIPGLSAAVVYDQEILWAGGYGMADPSRNIAATADSVYGICSISKLFTSIAIMQLRDAGKLRLDDPVSKLLPAYSVSQAYDDSGPVTVEGLLTHSAGLPADVPAPSSTGPDFHFATREELFRLQAAQETLHPASTYFEYSNLGISLAGEIVAQLSGLSYSDYVEQQILKPLGLSSTWTALPEEQVGKRMARGYGALGRDGTRSEVPMYQANGYAPAAGLASTVNDLARFAAWQFQLLGKGDDEVLAANSLREMYRPHFMLSDWNTSMGLGFESDKVDGKHFVGHAGTCPGFVSRLTLDPANRIAVAVMANANNVDVWNLSAMLHEIVAPAIEAATNSEESDSSTEQYSEYTGLYDAWPFNADTAFVVWDGKLAALRLSSDSPVRELRFWQHVDGDVFRRIRADGVLAETWTFERDSTGNVVHVKVYGDFLKKIR